MKARAILPLMAVVATLFGAPRASHADPATGALPPPPPQSPYIPVIMTDVGGDTNGPTQAALLEALSVALTRASLTSYAERVSGTSSDFAQRASVGGPLFVFGSVMSEFDTNFEHEVQAIAASAPQGTFTVSVEALMAKPSTQLPSAVDRLSGHPLRMLWQMGRIAAADRLSSSQINLLDDVANLAVVQKSDLPDGGASLYEQGKEVYAWNAEDARDKFRPLYERMTLSIVNGAVSLSFDVYLKPASFSKSGFDNSGKFIATRELNYLPPYFSDRPPVMRLRLTRTYGGPNAQRPLLALDFGRMFSNDIRAINNCVNDCSQELFKVPTISLDLQPSVINARLQPRGGANGFWANMDQNVENYFRRQLLNLVTWSEQETQDHTRFYISLNSLVIDLKDPAGPAIRPDLSQTPVTLRVTAPYTGDLSYMTFNQYNTTVGFETDLSYLHLGVGQVGGSINLFEKYLGPSISSGLSDSIRGSMRDLDRASDAYMTDVLSPVTNLIRE